MSEFIRAVRPARKRTNIVVVAVLSLAAMVTAGFMMQSAVVADTNDAAIASVIETGKAFSSVTKKVSPAVVFIKATKQRIPASNAQGFGDLNGQIPDDVLKRFFGDAMPPRQMPRQPQPMVGQGSGFIFSHDGFILTNNHVVGDADKLEVTLQDGRQYTASLVGTDKHTDVAVIKIDEADLPTLPLGDSDAIEVGEWVLAVGSPFGLSGTVTSGIVSAKKRASMGITDYEDFIQTDAAINPGNSGGPLVNLQGQAIGINTAIVSRSGGYNGIGFAIPMNMAREIVEQLMESGSVTRGFLGVIIQPVTPELARSFKLDETRGVLIGDVSADGPADKAGVRRGDVVVSLDGKPVKDATSFRNQVALIKPGDKARLEVLRGGRKQTVSVKIGRLSGETVARAPHSNSVNQLGLNVQTLDESLADKLGIEAEAGVVITQVAPGSAAAKEGLRAGMVIREVNQQPVRDARQFAEMVKSHEPSDSLLLLVQQGDHTRFVVLKLDS